MLITVIATGFEKAPVLKKVEKLSEKPVVKTSEPVVKRHSAADVGDDELEIPTFLRKNRFK